MVVRSIKCLFLLLIIFSIVALGLTQNKSDLNNTIQQNETDSKSKDEDVIETELSNVEDKHEESENEDDIETTLEEQPRISLKKRPKTFSVLKLTPEQMVKFKIWNYGIIPYYIDVVSYSDKVFRDIIRNSLQKINSITGVEFVELPVPPKNKKRRWVFFVNRRGIMECADHSVKNFSNQGVQQVILGYDCTVRKGELAEAVMSIVGVPAQHNAPDRDNYVTVNTKSIKSDKRHLFDKVNNDEWLFGNLGYDFESVTHYDMHKHSVDGHATIAPKDESKDISPSKWLSSTDVIKIKMMYTNILKKQHLPESDCKKLFQPRNKFERYTALSNKLKDDKQTDEHDYSDSVSEPETENQITEEKYTEMNNINHEKLEQSLTNNKQTDSQDSSVSHGETKLDVGKITGSKGKKTFLLYKFGAINKKKMEQKKAILTGKNRYFDDLEDLSDYTDS